MRIILLNILFYVFIQSLGFSVNDSLEKKGYYVVYFQYDSPEIYPPHIEKLDAIIDEFLKTIPIGSIEVYMEPTENEYNNDANIHLKRNKCIKEYLLTHGIKEFRISLYDKCLPIKDVVNDICNYGRCDIVFNKGYILLPELEFQYNNTDYIDTKTLEYNMNVLKEDRDKVILLLSLYYDYESGFELGLQRAVKVKDYLVKNGIDQDRIFISSLQEHDYVPSQIRKGGIIEFSYLGDLKGNNSYDQNGNINRLNFEKKIKFLSKKNKTIWLAYKKTKYYLNKLEEEKQRKDHPELYKTKWYNPMSWFD